MSIVAILSINPSVFSIKGSLLKFGNYKTGYALIAALSLSTACLTSSEVDCFSACVPLNFKVSNGGLTIPAQSQIKLICCHPKKNAILF